MCAGWKPAFLAEEFNQNYLATDSDERHPAALTQVTLEYV